MILLFPRAPYSLLHLAANIRTHMYTYIHHKLSEHTLQSHIYDLQKRAINMKRDLQKRAINMKRDLQKRAIQMKRDLQKRAIYMENSNQCNYTCLRSCCPVGKYQQHKSLQQRCCSKLQCIATHYNTTH